ncbi:MAG TPA: CmcI family methyltransferase, partial [Alphaproteobacteria bacterium]|nr:CmcI family methyltransferase [Alphaproteobacteria bacterium]
IDNGSTPPIEQEWVESFGPEFRLLRPSVRSSSPCAAINEAARQAKGRYLAIMIDGAHILSPGVFREVWDAVDDTPDVVVGLRQWFIGGDQRWLSVSGYSREQEDILFDKIHWPKDGYRMFKIGSPIWESPNHWLDGMIESNCLFVPRTIYDRIGGMDEAFDEAGGGYANLDLFKRAVDASPEPFTALLGEASFHQFHEGTTTNVADGEKDVRVRSYENTYMLLRGEHYLGIRPVDIRQRGQLRAQSAVVGRQRPLSPARLGVTDRVRTGSLTLHFDAMSAANLQSVYVECGLHKLTKWCGHEVQLAPADIVEIQDIVGNIRPARIVAVNLDYAVVNMLESFLRLTGTEGRILWVGADDATAHPLPGSVDAIAGDPYAPETLAVVEQAIGTEEDVLVLFAPRRDDYTPIDPLRSYARFVSCRSYLIFIGTVFGQPWLGYSKYWFQAVINILVRETPFVIDYSRNQQLVTVCPNGYLQRILTTPATSLDDMADFDDL